MKRMMQLHLMFDQQIIITSPLGLFMQNGVQSKIATTLGHSG